MQYGLYVSAAGALANSYRQDVVANNLANADTVGFKRDLALFTSRRTEVEAGGQRRNTAALLEGLGGGLFALPTYTDFSPGGLDDTGGNYDIAINGQGFFQVDKNGETLYTRDGRFARNQAHELVTLSTQLPVLNAAGGVIALDPKNPNFHVSDSGEVSQSGAVVGRIGIVNFENLQALEKRGDNLYSNGGAEAQAIVANVKQGYLEKSSVVVMEQLIEMIKTQRLFESNLNMLKLQDESLGQMIQRFAQR